MGPLNADGGTTKYMLKYIFEINFKSLETEV